MAGSNRRIWTAVHEELVRRGWTFKTARSGSHIQMRSPDGKTLLHTSRNGSDSRRAVDNLLAELRRAGETGLLEGK